MGSTIYPPGDVQAAIQKLHDESEQYQLQPHKLAAALLENCRKNNDIEGMKFWRSVWVRIMDDDYLTSLPIPKEQKPKHSQLPGEGQS
jgi:hypothetical protein